MAKIRKNDTVVVLAGKDKGRTGKVLRLVGDGKRVLVEQVNLHKHHLKANQQGQEAGIVEREAPLDISNVALVSPSTGEAVRVGYAFKEDSRGNQRKVRVVHATGEVLDPIP